LGDVVLGHHIECCALANREEWYFSVNKNECCLFVNGEEWYFSVNKKIVLFMGESVDRGAKVYDG